MWGGRDAFREEEGGWRCWTLALIDDWKFNLVGRESAMQLQDTACAALSAAIVYTVGCCTDTAFTFGATNSLCCEEYGKVKLLLTTACLKSYLEQDWAAFCFHPTCWHGAHRVENMQAPFPPAARAARVAEKSTGDLKNWVNTLYSPNLHALCAQSHTDQHCSAENEASFKKFRFFMSDHFAPFSMEWTHLHFGPSVQPSKPKRKKSIQKLMAWADTWSTIVPHLWLGATKNYNPRRW